MKKILGVIGGMGPEASAFFYDEVIAHTRAGSDQEHIDMIILSHASMPDRTKAILTGHEADLLDAMRRDLKIMETAGAANIAIPCNTSHYFYDRIQSMTRIPIINMVRETVKEAAATYSRDGEKPCVGIMATDGTVRTGVYEKELKEAGCSVVLPTPARQADIMSVIYDDIKGGRKPDRDKFESAYRELKEAGCDCVLLACTELSVYTRYYPAADDCIDAMEVLIRESVIRSGADYI